MRAAAIFIFDKCLYLRGRLRLTTAKGLSTYMSSRALATTTAPTMLRLQCLICFSVAFCLRSCVVRVRLRTVSFVPTFTSSRYRNSTYSFFTTNPYPSVSYCIYRMDHKKSPIYCLRKDTCSKPRQNCFGSWILHCLQLHVSCHANDVTQDVIEKY